MPPSITLSGMAWDHPRGYEPLRATSEAFAQRHPGLSIKWDIRSLKEFGDMPIEALIDRYDLITIDHPYMGQAYARQLLLPLEERLSESVLRILAQESVGPSFQSYYFKHHLFALPIDAAAQVAVSREDLLGKLSLALPQTRRDLFDFYRQVPNRQAVAWPLCPTDLWCSFLTLCAQDGGRAFIQNQSIKEKIGVGVLDELKQHLQYLHPESIHWNPIQVLDCMGASDEIAYAPFLFGYTNYAREGYSKNRLRFSNSPRKPQTEVSTILGGVGLAVSARCQHPDLAAAYVSYVASAQTQTGLYSQKGGQPANLKAWQSEANNVLCNHFFANTLDTMQKAYVRPQHRGWNQFQEQGAELLHRGLVKDVRSERIMKDLNQLYRSISL